MVLAFAMPIKQLNYASNQYPLNDDLENQIKSLIKGIATKVNNNDLEQIAEQLLDKLFELRIKSIQWLIQNKKDANILVHKASSFSVNTPYSTLNRTFKEVMTTYFEIITYPKDTTNIPPLLKDFSYDTMSINYPTFKHIIQSFPVPLPYILQLLDSSLKMEFAILTIILIEDGYIKNLNNKFISELEQFLQYKIESFGAYAMLANVWQPNRNDNTQLTTNIRIVAGAYQMKANKGKQISKNALEKLLLTEI